MALLDRLRVVLFTYDYAYSTAVVEHALQDMKRDQRVAQGDPFQWSQASGQLSSSEHFSK